MLYYKNAELASTYHVSVRTVRNWIESARQGKNDLTLHEHAGRHYVSNTSGNLALIEKLVAQGKKYRPHHTVKTVTPKPEFYKLFNDYQIRDIITSLEVHHEIPCQYGYFDKGAEIWNDYTWKLESEEAPNNINMTRKLLALDEKYLDELLETYDLVNVVDLGVGNGLPAKDLLSKLKSAGKLGRYIGVDISRDMLNIAQKNIVDWFGDTVIFEPHELDFSRDYFGDILAQHHIEKPDKKLCNIVLFFGGTAQNFRSQDDVFRVINSSMGLNDILLYAQKLDTLHSRGHFNFSTKGQSYVLPMKDMADLVGLSKDCYEIERNYDETARVRYIQLNLILPLEIEFRSQHGTYRVTLDKGHKVLLWRAWQNSAIDIVSKLDRNGFDILQTTQTRSQEYMLTVSQVKHS